VKSAYNGHDLSMNNQRSLEPIWILILRWKGPERIKTFLWLTVHDNLMINGNRARRHLTNNPVCELCNLELESTSHALRGCLFAKRIWLQLVEARGRRTFFEAGLLPWLMRNLESMCSSSNAVPWSFTFSVALWYACKGRNACLFGGNNVPVWSTIAGIKSLANDVWQNNVDRSRIYMTKNQKQVQLVGWKFPSTEWVKFLERLI
jgi:hypothetical protein